MDSCKRQIIDTLRLDVFTFFFLTLFLQLLHHHFFIFLTICSYSTVKYMHTIIHFFQKTIRSKCIAEVVTCT